ncbi:MAG: aldehyde dehydrogenase family protein, partial [Alphaproteobacteria bacterium]
MTERLEKLTPGQIVPFGGDRFARVSDDLAAAFKSGDRLIVIQETGDLLHVPAEVQALTEAAVTRAHLSFTTLSMVPDEDITAFFDGFAARLADDAVWAKIGDANDRDVAAARSRGRSTTRLVADPKMRKAMIEGLRQWRDAPPGRGRVVEHIDHQGWSVDQITAPLGVVAFVFEGRPNVFADATGVLRSGNTALFRIGSDALGTAQAIVEHALNPAIQAAGLPPGAAVLLDSADRSAGWAMFSDRRLGLAVARGSGAAVAQLGAVARQAGLPVSLHGTGGAWMVADETADAARFAEVIVTSLDRKVCNTLNVCCIFESRAHDLVPAFLAAIEKAGERLSTVT